MGYIAQITDDSGTAYDIKAKAIVGSVAFGVMGVHDIQVTDSIPTALGSEGDIWLVLDEPVG